MDTQTKPAIKDRAVAVAKQYAAKGMKRGTRLIDKIRGVLAAEYPEVEQWERVNIACDADRAVPSIRKPHNALAGYIASLRSNPRKGWVVIYDSAKQQLDATAGRYVTVCESHGQTEYATSMPAARVGLKDPTTFCVYCRYEAGEGPKPEDYDEVVAEHKEIIAARGF